MTNDNGITAARTDYFARREAQERALSERATDPAVRIPHEQLAKRYAELCRVPQPA